jgi:hypothetical protein
MLIYKSDKQQPTTHSSAAQPATYNQSNDEAIKVAHSILEYLTSLFFFISTNPGGHIFMIEDAANHSIVCFD